MVKRFDLIVVLALLVTLAAGCGSSSDKKGKSSADTYKVGILMPVDAFTPVVEGFKAGMAEKGYVEGKNVTYVYEGIIGDSSVSVLAEHTQPFIDEKVDVILAGGTPAALACQQAAGDIPTIFVLVTDPVGAGLVADWGAPGGHLTGLSDAKSEPKRLEYLSLLAPDVKRVYVPYNPDNQAGVKSLEWTQDVAQSLNLELVTPQVRTPEEVMQAITDTPEDIDAVFILSDVTLFGADYDAAWAALAEARQIPLAYPSGTGDGVAVINYGPDTVLSGEQASDMVDLVLRGTTPAQLPTQQIEFALTVNLVAAERYGIAMPDHLLRLAHTVIRE